MKNLSFSTFLFMLICVALFQSCSEDPCKDISCLNNSICEEGICNCDALYGVWNVTDIQPAFCTLLSYELSANSLNSILSITLDDGTRKLTGTGLIDSDCSSMTYSVSEGSTILSGSINFDGRTFVDMSSLGCLISATKQ